MKPDAVTLEMMLSEIQSLSARVAALEAAQPKTADVSLQFDAMRAANSHLSPL